MMRRSQTYKCPKCGGAVGLEANFESDEFGDRIEVEVVCGKCHDRRVDTIDEMTYDFAKLVRKIGT